MAEFLLCEQTLADAQLQIALFFGKSNSTNPFTTRTELC